MFKVKKSFWLKVSCFVGFSGQIVGSWERPEREDKVDLRSPVSQRSPVLQRAVVSPLCQANPNFPLYQVCREPQVATSPQGASSVNELSLSNPQKCETSDRIITVTTHSGLFVMLVSLEKYVHRGAQERIPKESHWISQERQTVCTKLKHFFITVDQLGTKDKRLYTGKLRLVGDEQNDALLSVIAASGSVHVHGENCHVEQES